MTVRKVTSASGKARSGCLSRTCPPTATHRFPSLPTDAPLQFSHLTRDAEAQELRAQLDRLEGLLGGLSKSPLTAGAVAAAGLTNFGQEVAEESAAEALGLLAVSDDSLCSDL